MPTRANPLATRLDRPFAGRLLVACGLCIGFVLAAAVAWYGVTSRQIALRDALREMCNDALLLADQEDRLLRSVEVVQLGLIEHMREIGIDSPEKFEQQMGSREVHQNLQDRIAGSSYMSALSLSDRNGILRNISMAWPPPRIDASGDEYIRNLTAPGAPDTFISAPTRGALTGKWIIYFSRRFEASDGRLIGFVLSTIRIDYFEQYYARLPLTGGGAFSLYRRDGLLMARYPHPDAKVGGSVADTVNFRRLLGALNDGDVRFTSIVDGEDRLVVPRAMEHFPLMVAVSDTVATILSGWRAEMRVLVAAAVLLELLIAGAILLGMRHLRGRTRLQAAETARARAEAELAVAAERERAASALHMRDLRLETAMQHMVQGLLMVDHRGDLLVVNRRFCELWGLPEGAVAAGTKYAEFTQIVCSLGNVRASDMAEGRRLRQELTGRTSPSTIVWTLSDGRAFSVTHQPMQEGWLTTYEDITQRRAAEARIAYLTRHDGLTGLPNRVMFRETLEHALGFARRGHLLALHSLDLDQFKAVNDTLGHPVGDGLLRAVARRLQDGLRETDTVARLGGDEFAIVQTAIASPVDATGLASRLIELIRAPFEIDGHQIVIGASIGITFAPQDSLDVDQLAKCADLALYRAKVDGRGVYRFFQAEMDAEMQLRRVMELDLRQALRSGQLELFYQPQIDARERRATGCEALLRWRHPTQGLVRPDQFIPLAEEIGMIVPIGEWALRQACADAATWPDQLKVAVNLSAVQFKSRHLVAAVATALQEAGLPASRLELEITESVMLRDFDATLATLHQLRDLGVRIAMDDFGTGYSSLSYLRRFPFNRIKIDQSFIRELGTRNDSLAIVRAVITLGHDLGMAITAEGVETRRQLEMLEQAGCHEIQGFLFSRAVPASTLIAVLRSIPRISEGWQHSDLDASSSRAGALEELPV